MTLRSGSLAQAHDHTIFIIYSCYARQICHDDDHASSAPFLYAGLRHHSKHKDLHQQVEHGNKQHEHALFASECRKGSTSCVCASLQWLLWREACRYKIQSNKIDKSWLSQACLRQDSTANGPRGDYQLQVRHQTCRYRAYILVMQAGGDDHNLAPADLKSSLIDFQARMQKLGRTLLASVEEALQPKLEEGAEHVDPSNTQRTASAGLPHRKSHDTLLEYYKGGLNSTRLLRYQNQQQPEVIHSARQTDCADHLLSGLWAHSLSAFMLRKRGLLAIALPTATTQAVWPFQDTLPRAGCAHSHNFKQFLKCQSSLPACPRAQNEAVSFQCPCPKLRALII